MASTRVSLRGSREVSWLLAVGGLAGYIILLLILIVILVGLGSGSGPLSGFLAGLILAALLLIALPVWLLSTILYTLSYLLSERRESLAVAYLIGAAISTLWLAVFSASLLQKLIRSSSPGWIEVVVAILSAVSAIALYYMFKNSRGGRAQS